jgi:hypothetical protein
MKTNSIKIMDLVRRIKDGVFRIPQFQREFKWKDPQITLLIDSIGRDYPIGSLLLSGKSPNISFASRSIDAVIEGEDSEEGTHSLLDDERQEDLAGTQMVLDGQQRLTSIARVFMNANPDKAFYFDLQEMHNAFTTDHEVNPSQWIKHRPRNKIEDKSPDTRDNGASIRADIALRLAHATPLVIAFFSKTYENSDTGIAAATVVLSVFETIRNYEVSYILLDGSQGIDAICRVFEIVNTAGTRLTTFDLAVARYFQTKDKLDLRSMYMESIAKYENLGQDRFNIDGERILQVISFGTSDEPQEPTRTRLMNIDGNFLEANWERAAKAISDTLSWCVDYCGFTRDTLQNNSLFIPLAYLFFLHSDGLLGDHRPGMNDDLKKCVFCTILQREVRRTNYDLKRDTRMLLEFYHKKQDLSFQKVDLSIDEILGLKRRDTRYRGIQALLMASGRDDILYGTTLTDTEMHHIFPLSRVKGHKQADSIANLMPISPKSNKEIGPRDPDQYFRDVKERAVLGKNYATYNARLQSHCIPFDIESDEFLSNFSAVRFSDFLKARAVAIRSKIRDIIGDSLIDNDESVA